MVNYLFHNDCNLLFFREKQDELKKSFVCFQYGRANSKDNHFQVFLIHAIIIRKKNYCKEVLSSLWFAINLSTQEITLTLTVNNN